MTRGIFIAHAASTLFMTGVIWFVQVVHYPLFEQVGAPGFAAYAEAHGRLTAFVVVPAMLLEAATALALLRWRPIEVGLGMAVTGAALLAVVWLSTFLLQVPQHEILVDGFSPGAHSLLVATNWVRTAAWSARGLLVCRMLGRRAG